ncbi:hypothetical protein ES707_03849 [subsurface metagenome]
MTSKGYALARAALVQALTAYSGITTLDGAVDGTTLVDSTLINRNDFITEKTILIMSGDAKDEDKGALSFVSETGIITLQGTGFSAQIKAGTVYRVLNISSVEIDVANIDTKIATGIYGDRIYFDEDTGIAGTAYPVGTPQTPSDVIADVITMCAARNLHKINVHGALTLGATMQHYCFFGSEHEDVTDTLDLSDEDVDGSHIEGLIVTGGQGGANFLTLIRCIVNVVTTFNGRMHQCSFWSGTCSFKDGGYIDLVECESIYGAVTITVQAPTRASIKNWRGNLILTAQDGGTCYVRGFKGTLEIDEMTAGTLNVYANGADITINADCSGGTINIYGNATITDNSGATVVNDYTVQVALDKLAGSEADTQIAARDLTAVGGGTSGENGADILTIPTTTRKKVHMLTVSMKNCQAAATITVRMYTKVNGTFEKFYDQGFTQGTDPDAIMAINGTLAILADLRVEMHSSDALDNSVTIPYSYILEDME